MNTQQELGYKEYVMRENEDFHAPLGQEFEFYNMVERGDVEKVKQRCGIEFSKSRGFGKLSENPLQSIKYHFVVTAALISRYCIEGGMEHEIAYGLSDLYIQHADACTTSVQVSELHTQMSLDYANRMKRLRKENVFSRPVVMCIDYIYNNLHKRILISELAKFAGINKSYLSRLFKSETGVTVTEYVQDKRIETAKNMLTFSKYQPSEIAAILAFPSQSYFIEVFKKKTGMTPKKYQNMHLCKIDIGEAAENSEHSV